jgi:hypothetical protein
MGSRWRNHKWIVGMGSMWALWGGLCWTLGLIFAILGIIADAINDAVGLGESSWFLLAIALFVAALSWYIGWAVAVYIDAIEAKKKE